MGAVRLKRRAGNQRGTAQGGGTRTPPLEIALAVAVNELVMTLSGGAALAQSGGGGASF